MSKVKASLHVKITIAVSLLHCLFIDVFKKPRGAKEIEKGTARYTQPLSQSNLPKTRNHTRGHTAKIDDTNETLATKDVYTFNYNS